MSETPEQQPSKLSSQQSAPQADPHPAPHSAQPSGAIQVPHEEMTFESIKQAIYLQAGALQQAHKPLSLLKLGKELYEILNRRLVFRTPAHKELPYFITPFGNLRVKHVHEDEIPDDTFVIE